MGRELPWAGRRHTLRFGDVTAKCILHRSKEGPLTDVAPLPSAVIAVASQASGGNPTTSGRTTTRRDTREKSEFNEHSPRIVPFSLAGRDSRARSGGLTLLLKLTYLPPKRHIKYFRFIRYSSQCHRWMGESEDARFRLWRASSGAPVKEVPNGRRRAIAR